MDDDVIGTLEVQTDLPAGSKIEVHERTYPSHPGSTALESEVYLVPISTASPQTVEREVPRQLVFVEKLCPKSGDVLVLNSDKCSQADAAELAKAVPPGVLVVRLPEGASLNWLQPDDLRKAGWVRADA